jgi:hypothetical protein
MAWLVYAILVAMGGLIYFYLAKDWRHLIARYSQPAGVAEDSALPPSHKAGYWGKQFIAASSARICPSAQKRNGKRYPLHKAPHLPLKNCNSELCQCWFKFLAERRSSLERRLGLEGRMLARANARHDRRHEPDRRTGNLLHQHSHA